MDPATRSPTGLRGPRPARPGHLALMGGVLALLATLLTLAWHDVLPGGWTLRGWVVPHARREAQRWARHREERLAAFAAEPTLPAGAVVFLGSSTVERFPVRELFPGVPCANRGIGMEDTAGLLARLPRSLPPDAGGVVLYVGSVDHRVLHVPTGELQERAATVLDAVRRRSPGADVLVLGLLPERSWGPDRQLALDEANHALRALAQERGMEFLLPGVPPLVTESGALAEEASADELHLGPLGYRELARRIRAEGGRVAARLAP